MASIAWLGRDAAAIADGVALGMAAIEDPPPEEEVVVLYRSMLLFLLLWLLMTHTMVLLLEGEVDGIDIAVTWMVDGVVAVVSVPLVRKVAEEWERPEAMEALRRSNDASLSS
jgi:hypothetical protein